MTASIYTNKYWCDSGRIFEMWLKAYGFSITDNNADVIIIDYDTWKTTHLNYKNNALIVILSSYNETYVEFPSNVLFKLIPIDYPITIEYIIKLLKPREIMV